MSKIGQVDQRSLHNGALNAVNYAPDGCVGCKEAAKILGLSHKTLNNWRVYGQGPRFFKYGLRGGAVRYLVSDLHAWRDAQARASTSSM